MMSSDRIWYFRGRREEWLLATLKDKLVTSFAESAEHFREGVLEVVPERVLSLLTADEISTMWSGVGIDDVSRN